MGNAIAQRRVVRVLGHAILVVHPMVLRPDTAALGTLVASTSRTSERLFAHWANVMGQVCGASTNRDGQRWCGLSPRDPGDEQVRHDRPTNAQVSVRRESFRARLGCAGPILRHTCLQLVHR